MAKDILYIEDGPTINVAWVNKIAISYDGVNWDSIDKTGVSAGMHRINLNTSVSNSYPEANKATGGVIVLKRSDSDGPIIKFNPDKVVNQASWTTPELALIDVISWLG